MRFYFGTLVAAALANSAMAGTDVSKNPEAQVPAKKSGHCVHSCVGYATCKGNGNSSCKGKNECANTGLVPKDCSVKVDAESCAKVQDKKKQTMCTWYTT